MSRIRLVSAVIGLMAFVVIDRHVFLTCPKMTRVGDTHLTVGDSDGDHANFEIGPPLSFSACSVGYDLNFSGGRGVLSALGSRGTLSYLDARLYAGAVQQAKCAGGCMAGPLNAYEAQGSIGHLLLIPANDEALASMKSAALPGGAKFHLTGNSLAYQSGQIDGQSFNGAIGNTGYFLVASIERE